MGEWISDLLTFNLCGCVLCTCCFYSGKLVLKIPWKNLYSEPVVAQVDGLYLLVRPNTGENCFY